MTAQPPPLTPELRALAQQSFQHQAAGRFAEAAQGYIAVLSRAPTLWSACYNLGLVYEQMGEREKSLAAMKQIYEADYGYRDVAERVESSYRQGASPV